MDVLHLLGLVYFASYLGTLMWVLTSTTAALCLLPNRWAAAYLAVLVCRPLPSRAAHSVDLCRLLGAACAVESLSHKDTRRQRTLSFFHESTSAQWSTLLIPLDRPISRWGKHFTRQALLAAQRRHRMQVTYEDKAAFTAGRPYVVGAPNSTLTNSPQILSYGLRVRRAAAAA